MKYPKLFIVKRKILTIFLCLSTSYLVADTITLQNRVNKAELDIKDINRNLKQVEVNQLNYKIEKDLLKETYSNNYENINIIVTIVLGVIGVLGYLGLKDITAIKKEYEAELSKLREIQSEFNLKSKELDTNKMKLEEDLKSIIRDNEEQSRKIKFIELKDKVRTLIKDNSLTGALEFANAALQIDEDVDLLNQKGIILCRLNQLPEAIETFNTALNHNPTHSTTLLNTVECLYFAKDLEPAKKIISENNSLFENKAQGMLMELLRIIELFHNEDKDALLAIAKGYVTYDNLKVKSKRVIGWDLQEANFFVYHQKDGDLKAILANIFWYLDAQIDGETLLRRLKIELPVNTKEEE